MPASPSSKTLKCSTRVDLNRAILRSIHNNTTQGNSSVRESYLLSPRAMVALVSLLHYKCGKIVSLKGKNQKVVKQTYFFNLIGGVDGFTPGYRTGQKFELDPGGEKPVTPEVCFFFK